MRNRIYSNHDSDGARHCNETCSQAVFHKGSKLYDYLVSLENRIAALERGSSSNNGSNTGGNNSGGNTSGGSTTTSYAGLKFAISGDSISTYKGIVGTEYIADHKTKYENGAIGSFTDANYVLTSSSQTWWKKMIDGVGGELLVNASFSGAGVTGHIGDEDIREDDETYIVTSATYKHRNACSPHRIAELSKNGVAPDVIVTLIGVNDWANNALLGTWDGSTTFVAPAITESETDYSTAIGLMITRMKAAYPSAKLVMCTMPLGYFYSFSIESNGLQKNTRGNTIVDYNNRIKSICSHMGVGVIDLYDTDIKVADDNWKQYYNNGSGVIDSSHDTIHPNKQGMAVLGAKAVADLQSMSWSNS